MLQWDAQTRAISDAEVLLDLAEEASDEDSAKEAAGQAAAVKRALDELEFKRMLSGELDPGGAIVQITAGAGGVDASDWAMMLMRMLIRYCERKGWKVDVLEETFAEEAGIKSATFTVAGDYAYGLLKAENGVHRLVRVWPFDANGRRQTSFAAVTVTADIDDDIEVDINEVDLDRHLPRRRRGWTARQQDRLGGAHHAHADRHRRAVPERAQPALEQGQGNEDAAREDLRLRAARSAKPKRTRTRVHA